MLWMVAQPLYALLYFFNKGVIFGQNLFGGFHNWGFSIIALTILVKLAFFWLNQKAYHSMAKMRTIQPKMLELKNLYPDDRQKQSREMMALYQKEGVNPLGGCLPILVQMPVFIALYWVLLESVELRHAPFIGYIKDLSAMDPYFILPLVMGASMWFQQKLNPPPPDPMQAKVMEFLPIIFTFFFLFFPSGLVLYWVVNNILSIAQQWVITRQVEKASKP
jgi:YidC/Oxa1 family membrane protein insertase